MNDKHQYYHCPENTQSFANQFPLIQGTFSPTSTVNDIYPTLLPSCSVERNINKPIEAPYATGVAPELTNWESYKFPKKIDLEVGSRELSPSGYYGPFETVLNSDSQCHETQWNGLYGQKPGNYSSCTQASKYYKNIESKAVVEEKQQMFKSCLYYNDMCHSENKVAESTENSYNNGLTYYDPKYPNATYYNQSVNGDYIPKLDTINISYLPLIEQPTEESNDESDIVVEDSSSEYSEEQESRLVYGTSKCVVCGTHYVPMGLQFYVLTSENPLTMSSQIPVKSKIIELTNENLFSDKNHLCSDCLGLINSVDHFQLKLNNLIKDLMTKLKNNTASSASNSKTPLSKQSFKNVRFVKYRCKMCKKTLCLNDYIQFHLKKHKCPVYLCETCGQTIRTFKSFKRHARFHAKKNIRLIQAYKCSNKKCEKIFRTTSHLKEHENYCLGLLPYKCKNSHCNKKFPSVTKLKNHVKLKHEKKFVAICSICNIGFVKMSNYKSHMSSHSTDKKYSCPKCEKSYKSVSNLNFHLKSHEKALPFLCTLCQKGFMRKEYYEAHMNNHKGVKNFSCSSCDKKFVSQKNLDAHLKYHEGTVKSNVCNICKKVVTSSIENHLRVHGNCKEFECDKCAMKFNTRNTLSKHKKRKH